MTHSPASASGDEPPAEAGLTAQDLTARLAADGELTAEEIAALARLDDGASHDSWDDDPGAGGDSRDDVAEVWDAGFIHGVPGDPGYGFAAGGLLDRMLPGRELAAFTGTALGDGLDRLSDYELIGFLCAARRTPPGSRLPSWPRSRTWSSGGPAPMAPPASTSPTRSPLR